MMGYGMWGGGWISMLFMWLVPLGLIGLVVYAAVRSANSGSRQHNNNNALNILNERFARGEIDEEEYKRRKQEIQR